MSRDKLKPLPCPFCGRAPMIDASPFGTLFAVQCISKRCEVSPSTGAHDSPDTAVKVWNRRRVLVKP